jgi:hypothetical protein
MMTHGRFPGSHVALRTRISVNKEFSAAAGGKLGLHALLQQATGNFSRNNLTSINLGIDEICHGPATFSFCPQQITSTQVIPSHAFLQQLTLSSFTVMMKKK